MLQTTKIFKHTEKVEDPNQNKKMSVYVMCEPNQKIKLKVKHSEEDFVRKMAKNGEKRQLAGNGGQSNRKETFYDTFDGIEIISDEESNQNCLGR